MLNHTSNHLRRYLGSMQTSRYYGRSIPRCITGRSPIAEKIQLNFTGILQKYFYFEQKYFNFTGILQK